MQILPISRRALSRIRPAFWPLPHDLRQDGRNQDPIRGFGEERMRIDVLGLQAFLSIAERGSFHAAAAHLNLSQTALSHRIRKLEEGLGVRLLARTTRQVALTPAGVELLPKARRLLDELGDAFEELRLQARRSDERIAIGCLPTVALKCLPRVLARFQILYPETSVRLFDNPASEIADRVQNGQAAFGITIVAANRWDLDLAPLVREPLVLVCRRDQPPAQRPAVTWDDLDGLPLVRISTETGNRVLVDDVLGERRDRLIWRYEVQRATTAVSLVRAGIAYAVVPQLAFDLVGDGHLRAVPLVDPVVYRTLGVITRKGFPLEPAAEALLGLIGETLRDTFPDKVA
jgi:DNA-binding transcriptional LysR family regulator